MSDVNISGCGCTYKSKNDKEELLACCDDKISLICINRDGDLFYVECPECHKIDITRKLILMCKCCGQHFSIYTEDGLSEYTVKSDGKEFIESNKSSKIIKLKDDGDWYMPYPRHNLEDIAPAEVRIVYRDLQKSGMDGHGHSKYKKYILLPVE